MIPREEVSCGSRFSSRLIKRKPSSISALKERILTRSGSGISDLTAWNTPSQPSSEDSTTRRYSSTVLKWAHRVRACAVDIAAGIFGSKLLPACLGKCDSPDINFKTDDDPLVEGREFLVQDGPNVPRSPPWRQLRPAGPASPVPGLPPPSAPPHGAVSANRPPSGSGSPLAGSEYRSVPARHWFPAIDPGSRLPPARLRCERQPAPARRLP